jgi:hypothetical protein
MAKRAMKSQKMADTAGAGPGRVMILWGRDMNGTTGTHVGGGAGPTRVGLGAGARASQGGWVSRPAHRLV